MAENIITLWVNGAIYGGWTSAQVTRSLRTVAADFEVELTEKWNGQTTNWRIQRGDAVTMALDGDVVLTGWVDDFAPSLAAETHGVRVSGRSKTGDLVDCAAIVSGGEFKGYTLAAIARALCHPFGIAVVAGDTGAPFADVQIQPGESCFDVIERLCRLRGFLACDNAGGALVLTRAGADGFGRAGPLVEGRNIVAANGKLSFASRFSTYIVRGQQAGSVDISGPQASQPEAQVKDAAVTRYRPKLIIAEAPGGLADMAQRARWQQRTDAAEGTQASVTVTDWRDATGALWTVGDLCAVDSPSLGLADDLLIVETTFTQNEQGTQTALQLMPPDALTPEPVPATKAAGGTSSQWGAVQ